MKVFVGVGHGGSDSGAIGYLIEKEVNLKIAKACFRYLNDMGIDAVISRDEDIDDPLNNKIKRCNVYKPDLAIDIHNNAGGGKGFEGYYSIIGGVGEKLAKKIETRVVELGQNSRGIKTRVNEYNMDYFGFIRETICPAVICEGAFLDNVNDYTFVDDDEKCNRLGIAYAKGILDTLGIEYNDKDYVNGYLVKVNVAALNIRSGPSLAYSIVSQINDYGVYTIIDEKKNGDISWGKLKSGAGWISLDYVSRIK